jgi:hypothetical protein
LRIGSLIKRANTSVGPPAENGTTIEIGREGQGCAMPVETEPKTTAHAQTTRYHYILTSSVNRK